MSQLRKPDFQPKYIEVRGFCEFTEVRTEGVTRFDAEKLHQVLKTSLPASIQQYVKDEVRLRGTRSMMYEVEVEPRHINEVAGIWRELLATNNDAKYKGRILKVVVEKKPEVKERNALFGKLKNIAEHEFGTENVQAQWYPQYTIDIVKNGERSKKFAHISAYGSKVMWGDAVTAGLGWTTTQADDKLASFRR